MTEKTCRLCLNDRKLTSIFDVRDSEPIAAKVMSLAKIFPDDGLSSLICFKCIKTLDICLKFISVCENTDIQLRTSIQSKLIIKKKTNSIINKNSNYIKTDCKTEFIDNCLNDHNDTLSFNEMLLHKNETKEDIQKYFLNNDYDEEKVDRKKSQKQQCFTCGKVMSSRFRLKTHLRTHTRERPFQCPHCNKNFSLTENLKVHLRIHTGEKPLICNICGDKFAQSAGLAVHIRKHTGQTPYKCKLCPRSFRTVGHLQYHTRRHTGEKNFECDTCGRAFITRSDLKQHLISHTGDKPHVCSVCGLRVTRASHLRRHMRHTHNEVLSERSVRPNLVKK